MHPDVRPQTSERVALVLANSAHERFDAVVGVQVLLGGRCTRADHAAHRALPTVGHGLTLMVLLVSVDGQLQNAITRTINDHTAIESFLYE